MSRKRKRPRRKRKTTQRSSTGVVERFERWQENLRRRPFFYFLLLMIGSLVYLSDAVPRIADLFQATVELVSHERPLDQVEHRQEDEILVIVQETIRTEGVADSDIPGEIERAFLNMSKQAGLERVRLERVPQTAGLEKSGETLRARDLTDATLALWVKETPVRVTIGAAVASKLEVSSTVGSSVGLLDPLVQEYEYTDSPQVTSSSGYVELITEDIPSDVSALAGLGVAIQLDDHEEAVALLDALITEERLEHAPAVKGLMLAWLAIRNTSLSFVDKAALLTNATELAPEFEILWVLRGWFESQIEERNEAETSFAHASSLIGETPTLAYIRALNLHALGRDREALDLLESALTLEPDFPEGLSLVADIRLELGDTSGAVAAARQALAIDPGEKEFNRPLAQLILARAFRDNGDIAEALEVYSAVAQSIPDEPEALGDAGQALRERADLLDQTGSEAARVVADLEESRRYFERALKLTESPDKQVELLRNIGNGDLQMWATTMDDAWLALARDSYEEAHQIILLNGLLSAEDIEPSLAAVVYLQNCPGAHDAAAASVREPGPEWGFNADPC